MSGTAPRGDADQGPCSVRACRRPYDHRGEHLIRRCAKYGCINPARNAEEQHCVRHESRAVYEKYQTLMANEYGGQP